MNKVVNCFFRIFKKEAASHCYKTLIRKYAQSWKGALHRLFLIPKFANWTSVLTSNFFSKLQKFDTSFYLLSWGTPTSDALSTLQYLLRTNNGADAGNGDGNYGRYTNPKFDRLVDAFRIEPDRQKRDAMIRESLLIINAELPVLPLHQAIIPWAMRKKLTAIFPPHNIPYFFRFRID